VSILSDVGSYETDGHGTTVPVVGEAFRDVAKLAGLLVELEAEEARYAFVVGSASARQC
jgi:hypothetical protein